MPSYICWIQLCNSTEKIASRNVLQRATFYFLTLNTFHSQYFFTFTWVKKLNQYLSTECLSFYHLWNTQAYLCLSEFYVFILKQLEHLHVLCLSLLHVNHTIFLISYSMNVLLYSFLNPFSHNVVLFWAALVFPSSLLLLVYSNAYSCLS